MTGGADRAKLIRSIYGLGRQAGLDNEEIHAVVFRETGKDSIRRCTDRQLGRVVAALRYVNGVAEARSGRLTARQRAYIEDLARRLGWASQPERLRGFLKKYCKTEALEWLTPRQASNVIEGLKSLLKQQEKGEAL